MDSLNLQAANLLPGAPATVVPALSRLLSATNEIFGSEPTIGESFDPEFPADKYLVLTVQTKLSPEQIVKAERDWIDVLLRVAPPCGDIRLNIEPI